MSELPELVDLSVIFPSLHIDLKYATADNITGAPIYREARCLLHTEAVTALAKCISIAQLAGLSLVVYDAYRPQQAQAILWNACPDPQYVVDVAIGSNHSRGTAIDVTLIMFGGGFVGINSEWWHFELPDAARYPLLDDQIDCYTVTSITTQHPL